VVDTGLLLPLLEESDKGDAELDESVVPVVEGEAGLTTFFLLKIPTDIIRSNPEPGDLRGFSAAAAGGSIVPFACFSSPTEAAAGCCFSAATRAAPFFGLAAAAALSC
jgi:hypothetical protein